jgi:hypothetical protein
MLYDFVQENIASTIKTFLSDFHHIQWLNEVITLIDQQAAMEFIHWPHNYDLFTLVADQR